MKNYIDADKLKAEIERLQCEQGFEDGETERGYQVAIKDILRVITSLQQKQPIRINSLTWKDINDIERIINNVHYEFRNGIGEQSFGEEVLERFIEERDEQEQPEVDLEKEIDACWQNWLSPSNQKEVEGVLPKTEFATYARYFYGLGLNARKEE